MIKSNSYFDGRIQSLGFERHARRQTVGVVVPGDYHFGTDGPERMTVICGELQVRQDGQTAYTTYPAGTSFEIPGRSGVDVRAAQMSAYWCEFI